LTKKPAEYTIKEIGFEGASMQVTIKCPSCNSDSSFFLVKDDLVGPFRCWKCKALFTVKVQKGELVKCDPLAEEDFTKAKADAAAKRKKAKEKA
jgi:transcription elongation factor Elf1